MDMTESRYLRENTTLVIKHMEIRWRHIPHRYVWIFAHGHDPVSQNVV